jgi:hypothetical protein
LDGNAPSAWPLAEAAGTGRDMGLAMVLGIRTQSGGYVDVESASGRGSTFHVYRPRVKVIASESPEASDRSGPPPQAAEHGEAPLPVQDEVSVRRFSHRTMSRL